MPYKQKDNEIVLFANDRNRNDKDPSGKGSAVVGGVEYWAARWWNTSKNGKQYETIKLTPKEEAAMDQRTQHSEEPPVDEQDIPF